MPNMAIFNPTSTGIFSRAEYRKSISRFVRVIGIRRRLKNLFKEPMGL